MPSSNEIRQAFLDYFARNGHEVVASSAAACRTTTRPCCSPTPAWSSSRTCSPGSSSRPYRRAATSQKCVRAGGKHNDLDNVGYTARHHTFFEMLGNFSFGDYFKELAIELAWKLVTEEYGLAKDRLLVTVYAEDDQAFDLWRKIAGLPESRVLPDPDLGQFLADGRHRPLRPLLGDLLRPWARRAGRAAGQRRRGRRPVRRDLEPGLHAVRADRARQAREPLPRPSIDTGMGLERIAAVLQGKHDNYDIDLFAPDRSAPARS